MKTMLRKIVRFAPPLLAAAGLSACTSLTSLTSLFADHEIKVRAVQNISGLESAQRDSLYESAKTAINARDYARALDYLQEARSRDPNNVHALNALGVVYDKLGRFDLSARYYSLASAADPNSRIVLANVGYSRVLQGLLSPASPMAVASAQTITDDSIIISLEKQPVELTATPAVIATLVLHDGAPAGQQSRVIPTGLLPLLPAVPREIIPTLPATKKVLTIGHPFKIMNASGRTGGGGPINHRLAMLGWTIQSSETGRVEPVTTLLYPPQNAFAARAMQRTLPFQVRLTQDDTDAAGIRLVVGSDYLSWKPKNANLGDLWQNETVVASLSKPSQTGGR